MATRRTRGGRPKKTGRREPNGRLSRAAIDHGTPELRRQRVRAHGMPDVGVTSPIDELAAKRLLIEPNDDPARNSIRRVLADRFTVMYCVSFGTPHPKVRGLTIGSRGSAAQNANSQPCEAR